MALFIKSTFTSAAGLKLDWKIECDALTDDDWAGIAAIMAPYVRSFRDAFGVPRGGLKLAEHMKKYRDPLSNYVLLTDDVWTTGHSMRGFATEQVNANYKQGAFQDCQDEGVLWKPQLWHGLVVFARGKTPWNVTSMFQSKIDELIGVEK